MKDLTNGNEAKLIFYFAVPMLIGNVFQQLYTTVDSVIVGRFIGKEALAAVGASFPIIFLLVSLIMGITMACSILISQYFGAKEMEKVKRTIDTTYIFLFCAAVLITGIGIIFSEPILRLLKTPPAILQLATTYLKIIFAGILATFGFNTISAILRGLGDSKTPLYFLIVSTIINIVLDLVFVLSFKWGVAGAAWATVIAQGVSVIFGLIYLRIQNEIFRFHWNRLTFDFLIFKQSLIIGLPTGVQQMLVAAGFMALSRIVNGFGTITIAAYTAASRLDSFASMPAMNLSMAVSSFVGQNLGAKKPERVKKGHLVALAMAGCISLSITAIVFIFGRELVALFTNDPGVIQIGYDYLRIVGVFYIVFSSMFITNGVLRGAGDTLVPMFATVLSLWLARVPVSALLSQKIGATGIWWGIPIGWTVGLILSVGYYLTGNWKKKIVVGILPELE